MILDFGKATTRKEPEIYKLTSSQRDRYNLKHPYLAHELRNIYGSKTSTETDIFSLGYIYQFVADDQNSFLKELKKDMLQEIAKQRITSPNIKKRFISWEKNLNV